MDLYSESKFAPIARGLGRIFGCLGWTCAVIFAGIVAVVLYGGEVFDSFWVAFGVSMAVVWLICKAWMALVGLIFR